MKPEKPEPIVITNFSGRLTRIPNGDLNSGFAKFGTSWGYDPFTKPMNLTWMEGPTDVTGVNDMVLDGQLRFIGESAPMVYMIGSTGKLWKVQTVSTTNNALHSVVGIHSVLSGGATYEKGGSIRPFGVSSLFYVGSDTQINSIRPDGSADTVIGTAANYAANVYRPLAEFKGNLVFGNGNTIGEINSSGTVTSSVVGTGIGNIYSALVPPLPIASRVHDLDVSLENEYIQISASETDYESIATAGSPALVNTIPSNSRIFYWNGIDGTATAGVNIPTTLVTALQSYLNKNHFFASDSMGAGVFNGAEKLFSLPNNKSPLPNATGVNGQFLFWVAPERVVPDIDGNTRNFQTMFYFGALDRENPPGLFRVMRQTPAAGSYGSTAEMPFAKLVSVQYSDLNAAQSSVRSTSFGTHYYSYRDISDDTVAQSVLGLRRLNVPPTGSGTPQLGVYETQTQLFSKKVSIKQVRVYTEPTVTGNGFDLDLIGSDGNVITNGDFSYSFAAGTDTTLLQGALERINFNPAMDSTYALGVRITNTGTTHMTIKKIEIDWEYEGK